MVLEFLEASIHGSESIRVVAIIRTRKRQEKMGNHNAWFAGDLILVVLQRI